LVADSRAGNRHAYQQLVERHQERLFVVAYDIMKNREDAEDVVQEAFVKAFFSLDKFKGESSIFSWLYRITFNMALDLKRKLKRRGGHHVEYKEQRNVSSDSSDDSPASTPAEAMESAIGSGKIESPFEALARKETGERLDEVFSGLSEEHREVITLREIDGLDYDEIAHRLEIPRGTVMSRLFYARKTLQKALHDVAPPPSQKVG
jgi:RNA polymerase sigma-70 factor (ECF subfamily)